MKNRIKLVVVAVVALSTTSVYATNGSVLMGIGAKARAMGGVGIGVGHGAESALVNPALITTIKKENEISFGGTIFMPSVSTDGGSAGTMSDESAADLNVIPAVSIATKINDNFYFGIGMWGTAGMGVDYRDATNPGAMAMVTNLQIMQFGVPLAYTRNNFSVGVTPVLQYGALDMNYNNGNQDANYAGTGAGVAQDLSMGYSLGLSYTIADVTIGASYKSQIDMEYKGQLSSATAPFVSSGVFPMAMADELSTPAEIGFGLSYKMNQHTFAVDYKMIQWEDAKGYKDFAWKNQNVIALGYEFETKAYALRVGYNYAKSPIEDAGAMTLAQVGSAMAAAGDTNPANAPKYMGGNALNTFNLAGFPGIVESHITVGGTYAFNDTVSLDLALAIAPESVTKLRTMPADMDGDTQPETDIETEVKHSQTSVTFQLNYNF